MLKYTQCQADDLCGLAFSDIKISEPPTSVAFYIGNIQSHSIYAPGVRFEDLSIQSVEGWLSGGTLLSLLELPGLHRLTFMDGVVKIFWQGEFEKIRFWRVEHD